MTQPLQPTRPHRRFNPLTGEWVLVSAQRTSRPWRGQVEVAAPDERPRYDPTCYLCPGNDRAGGAVNEQYTGTHVFTNDFAALVPGSDGSASHDDGVFRSETVSGTCRVVCFSPRHDLTLALMNQSEIRSVIDTWVEQSNELAVDYAWVQVFENRGSAMGASNPHPHGQIWASSSVPTIVRNDEGFEWKACPIGYDNDPVRVLNHYAGPEFRLLGCVTSQQDVAGPLQVIPLTDVLVPNDRRHRR